MKGLLIIFAFLMFCSSAWAAKIEEFPPEPEMNQLVRMLVFFTEGEYILFCQYKINAETENIDYQTARLLRAQGDFLVGRKFPVAYWWDFDGDGKQDEDEVLMDRAEDGFNGNEITHEFYKKMQELDRKIEERSAPRDRPL